LRGINLRKSVFIGVGTTLACVIVGFFLFLNYQPNEQTVTKEHTEETNPTEERRNLSELVGTMMKEFEEKDFKVNGMGISYNSKVIDVRILSYEEHFNMVKNDIEKTIVSKLKEHGFDGYKVKITRQEPEHVEKDFWASEMTSAVYAELTSETKYKINGIGYSLSSKSLSIDIKTSLHPSEQSSIDIARDIVETAHSIIESRKRDFPKFENEHYQINVYDKDGKKIN
jgi:hypothetical protein